MKKILSNWFVIFTIITLISCSKEEVKPEPEVFPVEVDDYLYLALRSDGQLFEIGDQTGEINSINKIPGIEFVTILNAVTTSSTNLYIYEHKFPPLQSKIHVYDLTTKATKTKSISFSKEVFGEDPGLVSLEWDEANSVLVGLLKEHFESGPNNNTRVVHIDPDNFEVIPMNLEFDRAHIISTQLLENNIYTSTYKTSVEDGSNDFFKIDLLTGTFTRLELPNMVWPPLHLSKNNTNNLLFGFLPVAESTFAGESKPVIINPENLEVTYLLPNDKVGNLNFSGRSYFNSESGEHVDFLTSATFFGLIKYNINTEKVKVTGLPIPNNLSSLVTIVGVKKVD